MPKRQRPAKQNLKAQAEEAYNLKTTKFKEKQKSDRELKLLNDLQKKGTLSDKVSALMLKIEKSFIPDKFCDFGSLDVLLQIAKKKSRHHSQASVEGLQELFLDTLLPDKPLSYISDLQVQKVPGGLSKLHFEDKLKQKYTEFINILKEHTQDTVEFYKKNAIKVLAGLAKKAELQDYILEVIVNKLGDPNTQIPTSVVLECNHLVWKNKNLIEPLLSTLNRFCMKPGQGSSGKFYAIVLMNSLKLTSNDSGCLQQLVSILLKMFPLLVKETRTSGNKAVSLLLKALNKNFALFPNKNSFQEFFKAETDELYRLTHVENTNIRIEALRFILQVEQAQGFVSDRFYRSLYEFIQPLMHLRSVTYKSAALLFNTLMLSMKEDPNISRVKAFVKRIFQVCLISEPHFILASLMLFSEISKVHKSLAQLFEVPSEDEEEMYEDAPDSEEETHESKKETSIKSSEKSTKSYDPFKRDPKFAKAENSSLFELKVLSNHPHPTISKWSSSLLKGESLEYEGDPLLDFTLINFLDRFEYRNPKKSLLNKLQGKKVRMSLIKDTVNSSEFKSLPLENVRDDELFFYKYFQLKPEVEKSEGSESVTNEEFPSDDEFAQMDFADEEDDPGAPKKKFKSIFVDADEYQAD
jgi:ribosome biogenesis protein MAK21